MVTRVKICGLNTTEAMSAALDAGADYVGLVFFGPSPRNVSIDHAAALATEARGRAEVVANLVDPDDVQLDRIVSEVQPDLLQLHGSESAERVAIIRKRTGTPVMKAIKVETAQDAETALVFATVADLVLFDAKPPKGALLPGGNGVAFDWKLLAGVADEVAFMLSGGLTASNVAEAVRASGAKIVDVSSGVERAPGVKDPELIRAFIEAARTHHIA